MWDTEITTRNRSTSMARYNSRQPSPPTSPPSAAAELPLHSRWLHGLAILQATRKTNCRLFLSLLGRSRSSLQPMWKVNRSRPYCLSVWPSGSDTTQRFIYRLDLLLSSARQLPPPAPVPHESRHCLIVVASCPHRSSPLPAVAMLSSTMPCLFTSWDIASWSMLQCLMITKFFLVFDGHTLI